MPGPPTGNPLPRDLHRHGWDPVLAAGIALLAFVWTWHCGLRGFFPFDQSIVFDLGHRIASGQVMYRDFILPMGPVLAWVQGLVFIVFGTSYPAYVGTAAAFAAMASLLVFTLIRRASGSRIYASMGALVTAAWFQAPFGTPWFEQAAGLCGLAALTCLVPRDGTNPGLRGVIASGVLAALAIFCKQNCGFVICAAVLVITLTRAWIHDRSTIRDGAAFCLSCGITVATIVSILCGQGDSELFLRHFVEIPASVGRERLLADPFTTLKGLLIGPYASEERWVLLGVAAVAFAGLLRRRVTDDRRPAALGALVALAGVAIQNTLLVSTKNQPENGQMMLGMSLGLAFGCWWPRSRARPPMTSPGRLAVLLVAGAASALVIANATQVGWDRTVHDVFDGATFGSAPADVPILDDLAWAEPTRIAGRGINPVDLRGLVGELKSRSGRFVVFTDFTLLYPMLDMEPPLPLPWFHRGLTYSREHAPQMDRWLLSRLQERAVTTVVIESVGWPDVMAEIERKAQRGESLTGIDPTKPMTGVIAANALDRDPLSDFPVTVEFLRTRFKIVATFGIFEVWARGP